MAAHRYWRFYCTASGGGGLVSLSEIQFREVAGVSQAFSGGTITTSGLDNGPPADAADSNIGTFWASGTLPGWWAYDYGAGNAKSIVEFALTARNDGFFAQGPTAFQVQYSDDGSSWTTSVSQLPGTWSAGSTQTFSALPPAIRQAWRFYCTAAGTVVSISEMQFREVAGSPQTFSGGAMTTGGDNTGPPSNVNDGNTSTFWASATIPGWLAYDYGTGVTKNIAEVSITSRNDGTWGPAQGPSAFHIDHSDGAGGWTTLASFSPAVWGAATTQTFALALPISPANFLFAA
jgi:F5/8 type C domain